MFVYAQNCIRPWVRERGDFCRCFACMELRVATLRSRIERASRNTCLCQGEDPHCLCGSRLEARLPDVFIKLEAFAAMEVFMRMSLPEIRKAGYKDRDQALKTFMEDALDNLADLEKSQNLMICDPVR